MERTTQKVLVTGATGFLGLHLVEGLCKGPYKVSVLCRRRIPEFQNLPLTIYDGDITNAQAVSKAVEGQDFVFHLAGVISSSRRDSLLMQEVNVGGTKNIIHSCISHHIKRLIYMSSVVAVGASYCPEVLNENSQYEEFCNSMGYFKTKKEAENLVLKAVSTKELKAVILNPSTIWGERDFRKSSRKIQKRVVEGRFPFYTKGGVSIVDVQAVVCAAISCLTKGREGERYILSGDNMTIQELFNILASEGGVKPPRFYLPSGVVKTFGFFGDILSFFGASFFLTSEKVLMGSLYHWFDSTKAQKELGFQTKSTQETLSQSVKWLKKNT